MALIRNFIDFVLHIDQHLGPLIVSSGPWIYVILFLVIFAETGLVFTPFLPGDSLLFAIGAFAAQEYLNLTLMLVLLSVAAILGDTVNYWVGHHLGMRVLEKSRFVKPEYLDRTKRFYDKHGKKTIILARFVPVVRTFAPFVAGIGKMHYGTFLFYNILGGILWVSAFILGGYFFGNIPFVKDHFGSFVILVIILSLVPLAVEVIRYYRSRPSKKVDVLSLEEPAKENSSQK